MAGFVMGMFSGLQPANIVDAGGLLNVPATRPIEETAPWPLPRHCERSEAIQRLPPEGFWIASLRSQ
ncbi:hypothetical protein FXV83_30070 [Bradyrhizobium hipponense]|uniref:Uncharacterized protein n=1 Tax=Bradyrhizobium hipponense TaxID=2605638 RepID=A0A5S4YHM7_9BRAD|nr:hypothetical protein FXV83_30070 [Bradyrhizobium hipponense]